MAQSLLIGLGGTGSRVVNNVVKMLKKQKKTINNGEICCAVLDTNVNDNEKIFGSGTNVPIFETSKPQRIYDYFNQYHHLNIEEWCPKSSRFMQQSMLDGCSEVRVKSRLAFMDAIETGVLNDFELLINEVLQNNTGSKIRVMIVSSLSGGTGSGMFIQVALWLRKILSQSQIMIRGVFLLPDIFISTIKDIRESAASRNRHYANAYAAIRELNTITKIKQSGNLDLPAPISLGKLFDSIIDEDTGLPVYDFAFFVDDRDENGVRLNSISEYEEAVAQLVYMQLYAPMVNDMYSEEDNTFLSFVQNEEPLYGACGTAKAEYPVDSVKLYCALRAASDAIDRGWRSIDDEIVHSKEKKKEAERDGYFSTEEFEDSAEYMRLFEEKTSRKPEEVGRDRFFIMISKDVMNKKLQKTSNGKIVAHYTDKVSDFLKLLKEKKIDACVTKKSIWDEQMRSDEEIERFVDAAHTRDVLERMITEDRDAVEDNIRSFEKHADAYAAEIVDSVFPYSMGDVNAGNACSLMGLLTRPNSEGKNEFIHPVAARYVAYKLLAVMKKEVGQIFPGSTREQALSEEYDDFDNPATRHTTERTAEELLASVKGEKAARFDEYERKYANYVNTMVAEATKYEQELLTVKVYTLLSQRVTSFAAQMEIFFKKLETVQKRFSDNLKKNCEETKGCSGKTLYIYGRKSDKERIYGDLNLDLDAINAGVNQSVIEAAYGRVCAEQRPRVEANRPYAKAGIIAPFEAETIRMFRQMLEKEDNTDIIDLDIYTAVCRQLDADEAERKAQMNSSEVEEEEEEETESYDPEEDRVIRDGTQDSAYRDAFIKLKKRLERMAAPFLIRTQEVSSNPQGIITTRKKTFWGFNPDTAKAFGQLGTILGVNTSTQANPMYPRNSLSCYRAVYGLEARYIPKFMESTDGEYYKNYKALIDSMTQEASGKKGESALVVTPHLDKRWHDLLLFSTGEKNQQDEDAFYHGLWLAIAYGTIRINKEGNFCLLRKIKGSFDTMMDDLSELLFEGKTIGKTDIPRLLNALRTDSMFRSGDLPELEKRFGSEMEELNTYVDTDVYKGLTVEDEYLNAVSFICRYYGSRKAEKAVTARMIGSLERIAEEMAEHYDTQRGVKQKEAAKFRICGRLYNSSKRVKNKADVFSHWVDKFAQLKIKSIEENAEE